VEKKKGGKKKKKKGKSRPTPRPRPRDIYDNSLMRFLWRWANAALISGGKGTKCAFNILMRF
jgi:carbamate kinase